MAITQQDIAVQMLAQLRMLDPSISAEVGTPERKILDSVASALADAQVDLTQLQGALDIDTKTGSNLDNFLALFGFGRQTATKASGFVEFTRELASLNDIRIPVATQVMAPAVDVTNEGIMNVYYETTFEVTLPAGQLSVQAPVRAVLAGVSGNVATGKVSTFGANFPYGIEGVNNPAPITGGIDAEDDDQLKVRFKNTIFRNLAGTQDQFIALSLSAAYTRKVNVVGPISRYREYLQVPPVDDATARNVDPQTAGAGSATEPGNGSAGQYTTALSTIPYSQHIYDSVANFVSNGQTGVNTIFWREGIDYIFNTVPADKNRGDAYRFYHTDLGTSLALGPDPLLTTQLVLNKPNVTFINVVDSTVDPNITAVRANDTLLFEHSYMSTASRNDWSRNVTNCVDVYIDGSNDTVASTIVPTPGSSTSWAFNNTATSKYYRNNYRRKGQPDIMPTAGNLFIPPFWQPVTGLPSEITVSGGGSTAIFYLNEHYWLVEEVTNLYGTVRARNGLEFNPALAGALSASDTARAGLRLNQFGPNLPLEIENYVYDKNIVDLQVAMEQAKQVTTDILVHRSRPRWFKLDITVMYTNGSNASATNGMIREAVVNWFAQQYFGNSIQLSDILSVIHNVVGVDNVRWSSDVPGNTDLNRVLETDVNGVGRTSGGSPIYFNSDFFMRDDELPLLAEDITDADITGEVARTWSALPGLIIRTRAQNTWISS